MSLFNWCSRRRRSNSLFIPYRRNLQFWP